MNRDRLLTRATLSQGVQSRDHQGAVGRFMGSPLFLSDLLTGHEPSDGAPVADSARSNIGNTPGRRPALRFMEREQARLAPPASSRRLEPLIIRHEAGPARSLFWRITDFRGNASLGVLTGSGACLGMKE